jgi:hypothetical protein
MVYYWLVGETVTIINGILWVSETVTIVNCVLFVSETITISDCVLLESDTTSISGVVTSTAFTECQLYVNVCMYVCVHGQQFELFYN